MIQITQNYTNPQMVRLAEQIHEQTGREIVVGKYTLAVRLKPVKINDVDYNHMWLWVALYDEEEDEEYEISGEYNIRLTNTGPWPGHPHVDTVDEPWEYAKTCLDRDTVRLMLRLAEEGNKWPVILNLAQQLASTYTNSPLRDVPKFTRCSCGKQSHPHTPPNNPTYSILLGLCLTCGSRVCSSCGQSSTLLGIALHANEKCSDTVDFEGNKHVVPKGESLKSCVSCAHIMLSRNMSLVGGADLCAYCTSSCNYCKTQFRRRSGTYIPEFACPDCRDEAERCGKCGTPTHESSITELDGSRLCRNCWWYCRFCPNKTSNRNLLCQNCSEVYTRTKCCGNYKLKEELDEDGICSRCRYYKKACHGPLCQGVIKPKRSFDDDLRTSDHKKKLCRLCEEHNRRQQHVEKILSEVAA